MKTKKIAVLTILVAIIALAVPASAVFSSQSIETKAERMVEIASEAQELIMSKVTQVENNETKYIMLLDSGLNELFYSNVSLCVEAGTTLNETDFFETGAFSTTQNGTGWEYLNASKEALLIPDYEDAIENAKDALEIFRQVIRSISNILFDAGIENDAVLDAQLLQEVIDRSQDRIDELRDLLADDGMLAKLDEAEELLVKAQGYLDSENRDNAQVSLHEANVLISQVCQDLRQIAQELNPQRIRDYCEEALRYRLRFMGRFGEAENEGFDVDAFLQQFGYQNEDDFMARFQEMIQNAENGETLEDILDDLEDIGYLIRQMDQNLTQEMQQHMAQHGQEGTNSDFGQNGGSSGSGQMSFGANQ